MLDKKTALCIDLGKKRKNKRHRLGVYEMYTGNSAKYFGKNKLAYDLDMGTDIPVEMIDFDKYIGKLEDY